MKELNQLVKRNCWEPKSVSELTAIERRRAVDAMMLLAEKNDGTIKGRCVFKGSETREWLSREDTASPTASHEGIGSRLLKSQTSALTAWPMSLSVLGSHAIHGRQRFAWTRAENSQAKSLLPSRTTLVLNAKSLPRKTRSPMASLNVFATEK